ncbi:MAG: DUF3168 domain-containing protein [Ottowia sp.]|uniref:tail completion protein gp17 n=1 Tax=Ottowia sp. TaxID=1898956 RepID=UPI003C71A782
MALEEELLRRLKLHCPRVATPTAPYGTQRPYVTWQSIGGQAKRYYDNSAPDYRNAFIQVNVWADTKKAAFDLLRLIEAELCEVVDDTFTSEPMEEALDSFVDLPDGRQTEGIKGAMQSFRIWGLR